MSRNQLSQLLLRYTTMSKLSKTAVVLIDPYNDFLHPDGKLTPFLKDLDEHSLIQNLKNLVKTAHLH